MKNIIIIPARMASTRLARKPLADICGLPMIVRVMKRAMEADVADVIVACAEQEIADAVKKHNGTAVLTDPNLPSGTDRIYAAFKTLKEQDRYNLVINLQGDLPTVDRETLISLIKLSESTGADMTTPGIIIPNDDLARLNSPNVVKIASSITENQLSGRALYFTRNPSPYGDGLKIQHLGIYAYKKEALKTYVSLPQTVLEKRERLEQLRALEHGMHIQVAIVNMPPIEVDTQEDLELAREFYRKAEE